MPAGGSLFLEQALKALVISVDMGELDYKAHAEEFVMLAEGAGAIPSYVAQRLAW